MSTMSTMILASKLGLHGDGCLENVGYIRYPVCSSSLTANSVQRKKTNQWKKPNERARQSECSLWCTEHPQGVRTVLMVCVSEHSTLERPKMIGSDFKSCWWSEKL